MYPSIHYVVWFSHLGYIVAKHKACVLWYFIKVITSHWQASETALSPYDVRTPTACHHLLTMRKVASDQALSKAKSLEAMWLCHGPQE